MLFGSETAVTAASRARMLQLERGGDKRAGLVGRLIQERERLIGALLLGNNVANILSSALATRLFLTLFGDAGVIEATLVMTAVVLIFAEILPKTLAIARPDATARALTPRHRLEEGADRGAALEPALRHLEHGILAEELQHRIEAAGVSVRVVAGDEIADALPRGELPGLHGYGRSSSAASITT